MCEKKKENIEKVIKTRFVDMANKPGEEYKLHAEEEYEIGEDQDKENIKITIFKKK